MAIMEFYCCDCELIFESEPDDTGYEQAPCPKCQRICMTSEFEGKSTKEDQSAIRFVVVAEFADEASAEPLIELLESSGMPVEVNLPDIVEGDFFTGGNDNVCVLVPADEADHARKLMEKMSK